MSIDQLDFPPVRESTLSAWWRRVRDEMGRVVQYVGLKQAAFDLDLSPSQLAHALAERDGRRPRAEWIPYLVHKAPDLELAKALVAPGRLEVERAPEMTPEEQLQRFEGALAETVCPEVRAIVYRRAGIRR